MDKIKQAVSLPRNGENRRPKLGTFGTGFRAQTRLLRKSNIWADPEGWEESCWMKGQHVKGLEGEREIWGEGEWEVGVHVWKKQSSGWKCQEMWMEEDRDHITGSFVSPGNEPGLYPEGKGVERRDVSRRAFGKHHCGHFTHSRWLVLWGSDAFVNLVNLIGIIPFPETVSN